MKLRKIIPSIVLVLEFVAPVALCQTSAGEFLAKGAEAMNKHLFDEAIANFTKAIELGIPGYYNFQISSVCQSASRDGLILAQILAQSDKSRCSRQQLDE
jgi:hypothetical protein